MGVVVETLGYGGYQKEIVALKTKSPLFVMFTGAPDRKTGVSWCPVCEDAEPVVKKCFKKRPGHLLIVGISMPSSTDKHDEFRKDPDLRVKNLPTLMRWGGRVRLEGDLVAERKLVEMLFDDET